MKTILEALTDKEEFLMHPAKTSSNLTNLKRIMSLLMFTGQGAHCLQLARVHLVPTLKGQAEGREQKVEVEGSSSELHKEKGSRIDDEWSIANVCGGNKLGIYIN